MTRTVHTLISSVGSIPSLLPRFDSHSRHRLLHHRQEPPPHSRPFDHTFSDSDDSNDELSVASDTTSTLRDWSHDEKSNDCIINHEDSTYHHPTKIYYDSEYNNYDPMDCLKDMRDLALLSRVQQIRNERCEHKCLDWNAHVALLHHRG